MAVHFSKVQGGKEKKINPQHLPGPGPEVHLSTLSFPAASADRSDKQPPKQPVTAPLGQGTFLGIRESIKEEIWCLDGQD